MQPQTTTTTRHSHAHTQTPTHARATPSTYCVSEQLGLVDEEVETELAEEELLRDIELSGEGGEIPTTERSDRVSKGHARIHISYTYMHTHTHTYTHIPCVHLVFADNDGIDVLDLGDLLVNLERLLVEVTVMLLVTH